MLVNTSVKCRNSGCVAVISSILLEIVKQGNPPDFQSMTPCTYFSKSYSPSPPLGSRAGQIGPTREDKKANGRVETGWTGLVK